jgi:hypothetical protein
VRIGSVLDDRATDCRHAAGTRIDPRDALGRQHRLGVAHTASLPWRAMMR